MDNETVRVENWQHVTASYGQALFKKWKYDEAIEAFAEAIDPHVAQLAWNAKGFALQKQGKYDGAIEAFDKVIEMDSKNAEAWKNKGIALEALGKDKRSQCRDKAKESCVGLDLIPHLTSPRVFIVKIDLVYVKVDSHLRYGKCYIKLRTTNIM